MMFCRRSSTVSTNYFGRGHYCICVFSSINPYRRQLMTTCINSEGSAKNQIRLTQYSHGAGCGCKISPSQLEEILKSEIKSTLTPSLLVGNETRDDAAVFDIGNNIGIISTTDFFMPIVDDPVTFGRIAGNKTITIIQKLSTLLYVPFLLATNAISDVYAMGGTPIMAVAILGWPLSKIPLHAAKKVVDGGRIACNDAGIPLGGGHSIDSPEPIFGLAVTGIVNKSKQRLRSCIVKVYVSLHE